MRYEIYKLVRRSEPGETWGRMYDLFISFVAIISIIPLMFKETTPFLDTLDTVTVYLLFMDYILRWIAHDFASKYKAPLSFLLYPVTPFAIIDFVSLLPSLRLISPAFRILRLLRIMKVFHYSKSFSYVGNAFKKERKVLGSVLLIAIFYIFVSALAMFIYEPNTFETFFDALYWATTALTTVGYGDVYPKTDVGQLISMISSLFGVAVIAMPAGIITASFVEEVNLNRADEAEREKRHHTSILERSLAKMKKEDYQGGHSDEETE